MKHVIFILVVLTSVGCEEIMKSKLTVKMNSRESKPDISRIEFLNDQMIIHGTNLQNSSEVKVQGSTNHTFEIETQSSSKLIVNAKSALSFLIGQTLDLVISNAHAAATFPITFELQNGQVTAVKLHHMGATAGQVLKFNGTNWSPESIAMTQIYVGTYDASTDTPDIVATGGTAGMYYIVTVAGTQNYGNGPISFDLGDWVIFNGTTWERIPVGHNTVSSFNSRQGIVVPMSGDYSWSMLAQTAGKLDGSKLEEIEDLDVTGIQDGDVLKWDASTTSWVVSADEVGSVAANSVDSAKITDGTIVNADVSASAAIDQSKILNLTTDLSNKEPAITAGTTAQYLSGNKSWQTLNTTAVPEGSNQYFTNARVIAAPLTGYTLGSATNLAATDTLLQAFGKLEAKANAATSGSTNYVLIDGTRAMTGNLDLGTNKIVNLATPTANTDAVTKAYADNLPGRWTESGGNVERATGNVSVGTTTSTNTKLNVEGQLRSKSFSVTTGAIDWSQGNSGTTSFNCSSDITFANLRDGGSYLLAVTSTETTQCNFSTTTTGDDAATVSYRFMPANAARTSTTHSIYSLQRIGSVVYVSWITGF
jgi:hypothetical protein